VDRNMKNIDLIIYTDGGARGNPGPAAIGVVICNNKGQIIKKYNQVIDEGTNNEAEYQAIIFALRKVKLLFGKQKAKLMNIEIRSDSELVVRQLNGQYKIKEENLQPLFIQIWNLKLDFQNVKFVQIKREKNKEADILVNQALDKQDEQNPLNI